MYLHYDIAVAMNSRDQYKIIKPCKILHFIAKQPYNSGYLKKSITNALNLLKQCDPWTKQSGKIKLYRLLAIRPDSAKCRPIDFSKVCTDASDLRILYPLKIHPLCYLASF